MIVMTISCFTIFVLCGVCHSADVDIEYYNSCPTSNSETPLVKLKDSLFCMYDSAHRPVANHKNATSVTFRLIMKYFYYEVMTSTLSLDMWLSVTWKDEHLNWKPAQFDNIDTLHVETREIWIPDLSVYNKANQGEDPQIIAGTSCRVTYQGVVICIPAVHIDALCVPDLTRYPFDVHNCILKLGSWAHKGEELDIKLIQKVVDLNDMIPNGEFAIKAVKTVKNAGIYKCCPNDTFPSIEITFKVERISGGHAASIVIPSIVVIMLTFAMLSLSALDKERLIIGYVNLIAQFLQVQFISYQIPLRGDNIPMLVLFGRDSLFLAVFAIIFTLIFKTIMEKKSTPPAWISSIISMVISCKPGQFILLNDFSVRGIASAKGEEDGATIVNSESSPNSQDWILFGKILDKLFFLSYAIVYFIMIAAFWP